jgi:hypothetical protein
MKTNIKNRNETFGGGKASYLTPMQELERSVMACMLWEDTFYESGESIANRIVRLVFECFAKGTTDEQMIELIHKCKFDMKLRHCPLWLIASCFKARHTIKKDIVCKFLTRPDDCGELLAMYSYDGKKPIPNQLKKGIALALCKFDEYQLQKWDRDGQYRLVDVVNLCHPKPTVAIDKLINGKLEVANTWEVNISKAGKDMDSKRDAWSKMLLENTIGDMAFLKNLKGIASAGVDSEIISHKFNNIKSKNLLPIDFIRAALMNDKKFHPQLESKFKELFSDNKIDGKTAILVDVSGSMEQKRKNSLTSLMDYACSIALIAKQTFADTTIYSFSDEVVKVDGRASGFKLINAIKDSQDHDCTYMWKAIETVYNMDKFDRLIVITDEQTFDNCNKKDVDISRKYIINIGTYDKGVGYENNIVHISGLSDKVIDYIIEYEKGV